MPLYRSSKHISPVAELVDPVCSALMNRETKRLQGVKENLIKDNSSLGGAPEGFLYQGTIYSNAKGPARRAAKLKPIHESLTNRAEDFQFLSNKLEIDRQILRQSLSVVIPKCRTKQDVRDALPETLIEDIPDFRGMQREREEGFLLDENPLLKSQFERAVSIALYYRVNQLIF